MKDEKKMIHIHTWTQTPNFATTSMAQGPAGSHARSHAGSARPKSSGAVRAETTNFGAERMGSLPWHLRTALEGKGAGLRADKRPKTDASKQPVTACRSSTHCARSDRVCVVGGGWERGGDRELSAQLNHRQLFLSTHFPTLCQRRTTTTQLTVDYTVGFSRKEDGGRQGSAQERIRTGCLAIRWRHCSLSLSLSLARSVWRSPSLSLPLSLSVSLSISLLRVAGCGRVVFLSLFRSLSLSFARSKRKKTNTWRHPRDFPVAFVFRPGRK